MKKLLMIAAIAVFGISNVNAQDFKLGASVGYLTEIGAVGFGGDAVYSLSDNLELALNGTYASEGVATWTAIDLNVHYMFDESFYALGGVEYLNLDVDIPALGGLLSAVGGASASEFGFNVGAGYRHPLSDAISLFGEAKYVAVSGGYAHVRAGVLFNL